VSVPAASAPSDPALARKAVERSGGLCCLCGRPCRPTDARRHSEPGAFGDSPANFAPMCPACRAWVERAGPAPSRYVVHVWLGPGVWMRRLQRGAFASVLALVGVTCLGYLGVVGYVLYHAARNGPWHVLGAGLLLIFVLGAAAGVLRELRARRGGPAHRIHHTFDPQTVHVRE
jgi:hypothetical protein